LSQEESSSQKQASLPSAFQQHYHRGSIRTSKTVIRKKFTHENVMSGEDFSQFIKNSENKYLKMHL
jgi:hypothetical protein